MGAISKSLGRKSDMTGENPVNLVIYANCEGFTCVDAPVHSFPRYESESEVHIA